MFSNIVPCDSVCNHKDKSNSVYIYHTFQSIFGRICVHCNMMRKEESPSIEENAIAIDETDSTSQKSTETRFENISLKNSDVEMRDLFTGEEYNNLCEISMRDISSNDSMLINSDDVDFLLKCSDSYGNIDKGKQNIFAKFDPLYSKSKAELKEEKIVSIYPSDCDVGYETGSTESNTDQSVLLVKHTNSSTPVISTFKEKPTQMVPPVMSDNNTSTASHYTPGLVRSASAIMPSRRVPVASLINIQNNSTHTIQSDFEPQHMNYNRSVGFSHLQATKNILQKQECELHHLKKQNKNLKILLSNLEMKKNTLYAELESNLKVVADENSKLLEQQSKLLHEIEEKSNEHLQLSLVMEEYENTISTLIDQQQKTIMNMHENEIKLKSDKDEALNHLASMESSFSDLLAKYEKCKTTIRELHKKEKLFDERISKYEKIVKQYQNNYTNLKQTTCEALNNVNKTWEDSMKNHQIEVTKLNATIKKHNITIASLSESLAQKKRDNEELTAICDDLISKVH